MHDAQEALTVDHKPELQIPDVAVASSLISIERGQNYVAVAQTKQTSLFNLCMPAGAMMKTCTGPYRDKASI